MDNAAKGNIIPALRYRDAPAAVEWLCRAFGFARHLVVPDGCGGRLHTARDLEGYLWNFGS